MLFRSKAVERHLQGEEVFLANYTDGLSDLHLPAIIDYAVRLRSTACFLSVRPTQSFHVVDIEGDGRVRDIQDLSRSGIWINGGFFVLRREVFRYMENGGELVHQPFQRLIARDDLVTYRYDGFWMSMDTFKDKQQLDDMYARGETPWAIWKPRAQEEKEDEKPLSAAVGEVRRT